MTSTDKEHIYRLIQHGRDEITEEIGNVEREGGSDTHSASQPPVEASDSNQEVRRLKLFILDTILQDTLQFKDLVVQEIEGTAKASFDSMVVTVEAKCKQWKESLRLKS